MNSRVQIIGAASLLCSLSLATPSRAGEGDDDKPKKPRAGKIVASSSSMFDYAVILLTEECQKIERAALAEPPGPAGPAAARADPPAGGPDLTEHEDLKAARKMGLTLDRAIRRLGHDGRADLLAFIDLKVNAFEANLKSLEDYRSELARNPEADQKEQRKRVEQAMTSGKKQAAYLLKIKKRLERRGKNVPARQE